MEESDRKKLKILLENTTLEEALAEVLEIYYPERTMGAVVLPREHLESLSEDLDKYNSEMEEDFPEDDFEEDKPQELPLDFKEFMGRKPGDILQ